MNLLFYRYGSICEPDIIEGFRELGNQVTEITLEIYNKNLGPLEGLTALKNELFAHSYDFVFSINYYPFISEICNIFQIRYLCWTVDCPVMELYSDTVSNPWNRIFLFDRAQYEEIAPQIPAAFSICRLPAIHPAGTTSFKRRPPRSTQNIPVMSRLSALCTPRNALMIV